MTNIKKRILIVNNNLITGGVQRSLVNLLNQIKDSYDITLFLFSNSGEYVKCIPSQVKVIEASPILRSLGMSQTQTRELGFIPYLIRGGLGLYTKVFNNSLPISFLVSTHEELSGYDIAISFLHNANEKSLYGGCNEFVLRKINAKQKITFVHCDFSKYGGNTSYNRKIYRSFDKVGVVSEGCRQSFINAIPEMAMRTHCVYNCHDYSDYISKANNHPFEYPQNGLNIVTVARLSPEKGILRGIDVLTRLVNENYKIYWHIVGDGSLRSEIEKKIKINNMEKNVIIYGNQRNPYRYIKNADMFFLPSLHEAAPMVIDEARCLGVPIITTETISAKEKIKENLDGIICGNNNNDIYNAFKRVINDPSIIEQCKTYLKEQKFTNQNAVEQFSRLIGDFDY
jgi:glycosyltransferase involved in cell wall biosynthesis